MIALLLGACAGAASAQEVTMGSSNHPTTVGIQAGHASASAYDPQGHNFISGAHPNAQTKDANPKPVKGSEGQRRTYQGQELVFHQGEWHTVKETGKGEAAPVEGQHGTYKGQMLTFHQGHWYRDAAGAAAGKTEKTGSNH